MTDHVRSSLPRVNIIGVGVNAMTMTQAVQQMQDWIELNARAYVSVCTVHTLMECRRNPAMARAVNQASLATPDGMPLVWLGRWLSGQPTTRVYGPDLMLALAELSVKHGYRHYFYGGAPDVPEKLAAILQAWYPGLQVAGAYSPPFRPLTSEEQTQVVAHINATKPDIVWVGLGTPKQDLWIAEYRPRLTAPLLIGIGAAFNIHTGQLPQAPRWMQQRGLEWLFRLIQEPQRLWYRYLVYNPLFVGLVVRQLLGWQDRLDEGKHKAD